MRISLLIASLWAVNVLVQPARDISAMLEALLADFDDQDYVVQAGSTLDPAARAALNDLIVRRLQFVNSTPSERIVIESVVMGDRASTVRIIKSPIAGVRGLTCSQRFTVPLRRSNGWEMVEKDVRAECVERAPEGLNASDARLLEGIRLAISALIPLPETRVTAASTVSANALRVMRRVTEIPTDDDRKPDTGDGAERPFVIRAIEMDGNTVTVTGQRSDVPKILPPPLMPGCGTRWKIRLRREPNGWASEEFSGAVC